MEKRRGIPQLLFLAPTGYRKRHFIQISFLWILIVADTSELLDAMIMSPVSDKSLLYRRPISYIRPVFPNTVMLSPTLNGLVLARYNPAIRFPMSDCEANPITNPVIVVMEAATSGSLLRYEITTAAITIALAILMKILIEWAVSPK